MSINRKKLEEISGKSTWKERAVERQKNKQWRKLSIKIAVRILTRLDELGWKQKDLAKKLNVSPQQINKIVKGKENLTLEYIAKLNDALDTDLLTETKIKKEIIVKMVPVKVKYNRYESHIYENNMPLSNAI